MQVLTSLFQTQAAGGSSAAGNIGPGITKSLQGSVGNTAGSGGFGLDRLFGSSQNIPFVGPVISVFQAFNDERDARSAASRIDFNARAEELIGKQQTVSALRTLNDVQAHNVVAGFTSGGGISGSRGRVIADVSRDAQLGFDLIRTNAEIKAADLRQTAKFILQKQFA